MKERSKRKLYRTMWIILGIIAALVIGVFVFINLPRFGSIPRGERLERVESSPNYRKGSFHNAQLTRQLTSDRGFLGSMADFLFRKNDRLRPAGEIPSVRTNLWDLDREKDLLVWFGHSSYLLQTDGKRILVDPTLMGAGSPVPFINRPFAGTDVYRPEDIPEIDYLVISHDHWDHLDYRTVKALKGRTEKVVCGLGVGEHFRRWGFDPERIVELDWGEGARLDDGIEVHCLPARHFSGRGLKPNQSLWASYLFEMPSRRVYIGGDGGYGKHYAEIGERFGDIDLAILENGQYNEDWKYIHTMPQQVVQAFGDLRARRLFTVHHSKYALGRHPWDEPLKNISAFARKDSIDLIQPMIGQVVDLNDGTYTLERWCETLQ